MDRLQEAVGFDSEGSIQPHGGRLTPRMVAGGDAEVDPQGAIELDARALADLECLAVGVFSPLQGFLTRPDYESVVSRMRLADGTPWSLPITIRIDDPKQAQGKSRVALASRGRVVGVLDVTEVFEADQTREAVEVFGTSDPSHPGVGPLLSQGRFVVGGPVSVFGLGDTPYASHRLTPEQTRAEFQKRGWKTVAGFQTRNPIHRAHEYLTKVALEICDGLLLHPLVGETKAGDTPADVRMRAYDVLLENYYPRDRVLLGVFPAAMRYGGPREAVFHAICRKNYGCTHFIVGRDHAGAGGFYGPYDAQKIFDKFEPGELGIEILKFENSFFCKSCGQMATIKTCPHGQEARLSLSGTEVRRRMSAGEPLPVEFSRPEVVAILAEDVSGGNSGRS